MLISVDVKQLEWRVLLELSQDPVGIKEILNNEDSHALNQAAFSLPSRLIAKIFLFRTIFRGTGYSFSIDPDFAHVSTSSDFWDTKNEQFYKKYKGVDACHYQWKKLCEDGKPIISPFGREWDVPLLNQYGKINWTQFTNYPVQGTGADIMMIARISFWNRVVKAGLENIIKLVQTVHDSIVVDCPKEYLKWVVETFHQVFKDLIANIKKLFGYDWKVPLDCECSYGDNQKDVTTVDLSQV